MHPLLRYAKARKISQAELARYLDLSPQFVNDVIKGRSHLGRENALRVVEKTGGSVTLEELLTWDPEASTAA